jgi:hypothetical protein
MPGRSRPHTVRTQVRGPWSLATSRGFWEGFTPAALPVAGVHDDGVLRTVFRVDADWSRASAEVTQDGAVATITVRALHEQRTHEMAGPPSRRRAHRPVRGSGT